MSASGNSPLYVRGLSDETRKFIREQATAQNYHSEAAYVRAILDNARLMFERAQAMAAKRGSK